MLFRPPWRKIEDIGEYAEALGFEEESYLDLFQAVMELDKKYRVSVLLFYYERYSTAEIASILIIPELSEPPVRTLGATIPENESHIFR